ncbi:DUF2939 domain-containing protein [Thermus sp.]|uniref:DUF2939 domain-containing protein n=1 Tax=Thermus sp. TaxID=275 RepID=UPI00307D2DF0
MRRVAGWAAALVLVLVGAFFASPYLALRGLGEAVVRQDAQALERYIDFPRVREALKADLNAALLKEMQGTQDPFAGLGLLFAAGMVEAFLTPEGLAALGTGLEPGEASLEEARRWRLRWEGLGRVFVHSPEDPSTGLVMERQGLRWKVVRLRLPPP